MLKTTLIGNLGADPDLRYSASGSPLLRMNVAANYRTRTPEGEYQEQTEWVRVTVIGTRAESLSQYLHKGMKIYAEGRLEARPWTDQQGQVRAGLEVLADEVQFMSPRQDDGERAGTGGASVRTSTPVHPTPPGPAASRQTQPAPRSRPDPALEDDLTDLPF